MLLVVLDTTRADRLSCYGGPEGATPNLDALAAGGVRFERAYAHAPWTLPSTASLLTSLHPRQHGAGGYLDLGGDGRPPRPLFRGLAPPVETVAEVFGAAGWSTGAVVNVDFLAPAFGLMQGFDHVDAHSPRSNRDVRSAQVTTTTALAWLREQGERPTFLLVHYFDPHAVYEPPAEFRRRFADPRDRDDDRFVFGTRDQMLRLRDGSLPLDPDEIARASALYNGEIAYADQEIGRLLDGLADLGRADDTIVVFTSDHGEEFLDHGGFEHGHSMFDELIRVPLILSLPDVLEPTVVREQVRHIDVAPTLCELAGIPVPAAFAGRNLLVDAARPALAHGNFWGLPRTSWVSGDHKLVLEPNPDGGERVLLFDLSADPGETADVALAHPDVIARMRSELDVHARWLSGGDVEEVQLSAEELDALRALGYAPGESSGE